MFILNIIFGLTLFSSAQNLAYDDANFGCTSSSQAQKYINDFHIDLKSFGGLELCDAKVDTKKLFNDLEIIENGHFNPDLTNKFIAGFIPVNTYYSWMKSQTYGVERGNDIPFATAYNSNGYFTMQNGWTLLTTLGRVGTVIHEARHTAGYRHEICPAGPYKDTTVSGCDDKFSSGGSHAVEMEYYARVALTGDNFHPVYKAMARLMAMARSNFVFSESPIKLRKALVTIDSDQTTRVYDGANVVERRTPLTQGVLKRTSFGASIFDGLHAFAIEMYENFESASDLNDIYSYFKLLLQERGQGPNVHDFEEFDYGSKRYVFVLDQSSEIAKYNFGKGGFDRYVSAPSGAESFHTVSPDGNEGLFLRDTQNQVYSVNPDNLNNIQKLNTLWPNDTLSYANWNNSRWALNKSQDVLKFENGTWVVQGSMGKVLQMTTAPLYDAFEVVK